MALNAIIMDGSSKTLYMKQSQQCMLCISNKCCGWFIEESSLCGSASTTHLLFSWKATYLLIVGKKSILQDFSRFSDTRLKFYF